jgi:hypothetical protein
MSTDLTGDAITQMNHHGAKNRVLTIGAGRRSLRKSGVTSVIRASRVALLTGAVLVLPAVPADRRRDADAVA